MENSVLYIEKQLWDPELGMIMRYLPFYKDFSTHVHAGNGPLSLALSPKIFAAVRFAMIRKPRKYFGGEGTYMQQPPSP